MSKWEKHRLICYKHDKLNHQLSFDQNSLCPIYYMKTTKKKHDYDVENDKRHPSPKQRQNGSKSLPRPVPYPASASIDTTSKALQTPLYSQTILR